MHTSIVAIIAFVWWHCFLYDGFIMLHSNLSYMCREQQQEEASATGGGSDSSLHLHFQDAKEEEEEEAEEAPPQQPTKRLPFAYTCMHIFAFCFDTHIST